MIVLRMTKTPIFLEYIIELIKFKLKSLIMRSIPIPYPLFRVDYW